jgi:hypothetical protein
MSVEEWSVAGFIRIGVSLQAYTGFGAQSDYVPVTGVGSSCLQSAEKKAI